MTTKFLTKNKALKAGLKYAGLEPNLSLLKKVEKADITQFGESIHAEVYDLKNRNGDLIRIATSPYRDGFDLWLIKSDGNFAHRI